MNRTQQENECTGKETQEPYGPLRPPPAPELFRQTRSVVLSGAAFVFTACATTPLRPFPATHPASPEAPEASIPPFQTKLAADEATKKSHALLAAAEKGTPAPAPTQSSGASDMPGVDMGGSHEHH